MQSGTTNKIKVMKIKKEIHWLVIDNQDGNRAEMFTTEAEQRKRIQELMKDAGWPELAEEMGKMKDGDDWSDLWEQFAEDQSGDCNYFNHGCDTVEIELTADDVKNYHYEIALTGES